MQATEIRTSKLDVFRSQLKPTTLPFLVGQRTVAEEVLLSNDFPTTRVEAWKYTRLTRIAALLPTNKYWSAEIKPTSDFGDVPTYTFVNGCYVPQLSTPISDTTVAIKSLSACTNAEFSTIGKNITLENEVFHSLNTLYASDGIFIDVPAKTKLDCIRIHHITTGEQQASHIRNVIHLGKSSNTEFIFHFSSLDSTQAMVNVITEIALDENASCQVYKIQNETEEVFHVSTEQVHQSANSSFSIHTHTLNGLFVRNNLNIAVAGENCTTILNGTYVLKDQQYVDNHTRVEHLAPNCYSSELYKGVLSDKSTAVFNGKVLVAEGAQKINAFQSNGNVLLSDDATIYSKPELEIYADDVKCSHGSTTGQLDDEAVFYLKARGISEEAAKGLLVSAFVNEVLESISNGTVSDFAKKTLQTRFGIDF
jgi:Fe-S cluster assembly protein SufD